MSDIETNTSLSLYLKSAKSTISLKKGSSGITLKLVRDSLTESHFITIEKEDVYPFLEDMKMFCIAAIESIDKDKLNGKTI